jgi:CSLREA domain-containing protein
VARVSAQPQEVIMAGPVRCRALVPLGGFLLLSLGGCLDRELPTAPAVEEPAFDFMISGPVVNDNGDVNDGTCDATHCTLREAVNAAEPNQTITFAPGLASPIVLTQGQINIQNDLAIFGPGAGQLTVDAAQTTPSSTGSVFRILNATVYIFDLTITGGYAISQGGGITINSGQLLLLRSVVTGNSARDDGGGIYGWQSDVRLFESTISNNWAGYSGGGIALGYGSTLTVEQSTISGNSSDNDGGGISSDWSPMALDRTTVSGNSAGQYGGGITCNGTGSTIINSTISGNSASGYGGGGGIKALNCEVRISHSTITANQAAASGGGISASDHEGSNVIVRNTVIWGNHMSTSPDDVASDDELAHFTSLGYNLVGTVGAGNAFAATGDQTGVTEANIGSLAINEPGATATHALLEGSPAINTGTCSDPAEVAVTVDQRGVSRPQGGVCDIGAFELEGVSPPPPPPPAPVFSCTFQRNVKNGQLAILVSWENAHPGVTLIEVVDGRTLTKQQAPSASGVWSTSVKSSSDVLTYGVWGGASRKDTTHVLVPAGTACTMLT